MLLLTAGCHSRPTNVDVSGLAALRLESIDLEADRITFALYNTTELPLPLAATGDYYLGEIVVIADGRASLFMDSEIALDRLQALHTYERMPDLQPQACVRWSLPLSSMTRISAENDMESLLLDEEIQRRERFERDPEAYRLIHGIPSDSTPMFTNRQRLPLPPTLLEYLRKYPDHVVAIQPTNLVLGRAVGDGTIAYGYFRERSNWLE
ncbi:MAG: hypothetical protein AAGI37_08090 [Planctomycetota bacterium]